MSPIRLYEVFNIVWDTDGLNIENLPSATIVECKDDDFGAEEEEIANALSDKYDWCVISYEYRRIRTMKHYLIHFKQTVDGVDSELSRYWRCDAEDYNHAIEQLNSEVVGSQGEKVIFHELIKVSI